MGKGYERLGAVDSAMEMQGRAIINYDRALQLAKESGSTGEEAKALVGIGQCQHHLAEYKKAVMCFNRALGLFQVSRYNTQRSSLISCPSAGRRG
jgi:tetratricopeptide (TPR) repeat protein